MWAAIVYAVAGASGRSEQSNKNFHETWRGEQTDLDTVRAKAQRICTAGGRKTGGVVGVTMFLVAGMQGSGSTRKQRPGP